MSSDAKFIGIGLLIGAGIATLLLAAAFAIGILPPKPRALEAPPSPAPALDLAPSATPAFKEAAATSTAAPEAAISPVSFAPAIDWEAVFAQQVLQSLPTYGGEWHILIRKNGAHTVFALNADKKDHVASIIKLPFAMLFFKALEAKGIQPAQYDEYLSTRGIGRTYRQLLRAMLVESEELAAKTLREATRDSGINEAALLREWGAPRTNLSKRLSTPEEIAALYESLYYGRALNPQARAIILNYLSEYTPNDDARLGVLRRLLPPGGAFYNKRGSVTEERLVIGDSALVAWEENGVEQVYVLVAIGYNGEIPATDKKLVRGIETIALQFWNFIVLQAR